jgi:hypothetical protein
MFAYFYKDNRALFLRVISGNYSKKKKYPKALKITGSLFFEPCFGKSSHYIL